MKTSWSQPSLSRDFAVLSATILFVLCIVSAWVTYTTYNANTERIGIELDKESKRIENMLGSQMDDANYMLTSLGKHIVLDTDHNLIKLAQLLKAFDRKDYIYTILSWVNTDQQLAVSSNKGVLEKSVDISDRDYVKKSLADPWKMMVGRPIEGRVSGRWVIPVSMGLTDYTGKFIGTIMISIDINALTERMNNLIRRDGASFAIVSKTLIPITQISDDKDFVSNHFPIQKLVNFNFTQNPGGLITRGNAFWDPSQYFYYRAAADLPYIILLGYDKNLAENNLHSLLLSKLLQMLAMAVFFILFLWITRMRMIKPVMELTQIAANVARGSDYNPLPKGGPVEIEGLASQMYKISDYIEETKRIESELRNKIYLLKQAKDNAEIDRRSQSEFMAFVSQEMRHPINNIIGASQVLKDQLHGPLENRKYRQYASDIYNTSNLLMNRTQDLITLSKVENGYIELVEKPVDVAAVINRSLRFVSDKMQAEKLGIKVQMQDPLPRLIGDEFRLQQIVMNLLLHTLSHALPESTLLLEAKIISESRERMFFTIIINSNGQSPYSPEELLALADRLSKTSSHWHSYDFAALINNQTDVSMELAKTLISLHQGTFDIRQAADNTVTIAVFFNHTRIRFMDAADK